MTGYYCGLPRRMSQAFSTMVLASQQRLRGMIIGLMEPALQEEKDIDSDKLVFSSGSAWTAGDRGHR